MPPIEINGETVNDVQVNGQSVDEVTANGQTVFSAIPDSEDLHIRTSAKEIDFNDGENIDSVDDLVGNNDLTGSGTYRGDSINGNPSIDYDGTDDKHAVEFDSGDVLSPPFSFFGVWGWDNLTSDSDYIFDTHDPNGDANGALRDGNWRGEGSELAFTSDTNIHIWGIIVTETQTTLRIDGTVVDEGDVGAVDWDCLVQGGRMDDFAPADSRFGEVLGYEGDKSDSTSEIEQYLSNEWGI